MMFDCIVVAVLVAWAVVKPRQSGGVSFYG